MTSADAPTSSTVMPEGVVDWHHPEYTADRWDDQKQHKQEFTRRGVQKMGKKIKPGTAVCVCVCVLVVIYIHICIHSSSICIRKKDGILDIGRGNMLDSGQYCTHKLDPCEYKPSRREREEKRREVITRKEERHSRLTTVQAVRLLL